MTLNNDAKFEEGLSCEFKIYIKNLRNFDPSTQNSQKFTLYLAAFGQICLKALKIDAKFEGKLCFQKRHEELSKFLLTR